MCASRLLSVVRGNAWERDRQHTHTHTHTHTHAHTHTHTRTHTHTHTQREREREREREGGRERERTVPLAGFSAGQATARSVVPFHGCHAVYRQPCTCAHTHRETQREGERRLMSTAVTVTVYEERTSWGISEW